jgi:hypothetical protein
MMIRQTINRGLKAACAAGLAATVAYGFASGPPAGHTGAPGEQTCIQCHSGTLNSGPGSITITGVPDSYEPGQEFTLTVRVQHPDRRRWGFQITALDAENRPAGTLAAVNRNLTRVISGTGSLEGRTYVEHVTNGTFAGQALAGEWQVKWTAPAVDVGRVTFYAAGNAANNNNASSGDSIYTTAVPTGSSAAPMIVAPVYKKGKILVQANASNIESGATLEVSGENVDGAQIFPLVQNATGTKWLVKKSARSTPGALSVDQVLPAGAAVTLVVRNPDGTASAPATLRR